MIRGTAAVLLAGLLAALLTVPLGPARRALGTAWRALGAAWTTATADSDFRDPLDRFPSADDRPLAPSDEPPAEPNSLFIFKAASAQTPFPPLPFLSPGLTPEVWLDWSTPARSKNRPLEKLSLAAGQAIWLPHLAGDESPLVVRFRQGTREREPAKLPLDLRPDFVLEHPLGLYVLAQGFLFQFRTADAQIPWGMKTCLVRRIDAGNEPLAGSLRQAPDGSIWMQLSGGPATLAGMDGRPVRVSAGDSLWKVDAEGRFLQWRAQGPAGALRQLVGGPNGAYYLRVAKSEGGAGEARQGFRSLSSFEFLKSPLPPGMNRSLSGGFGSELIVALPAKEGRPEQYLLLEAHAKTGRVTQQKLDLESSILFPSGEIRTVASGLTQPALAALSDGSAALFGLSPQSSTAERTLVLGGFALDPANPAPVAVPGPSVSKLGPAPLAKMVAATDPVQAWRAWAEARSRIDKRMTALNSTPPPLMAELRKRAQEEEIEEAALGRLVSLLEACGDWESRKAIQFLAEEGATTIRVQCLESLGRLAGPQDQTIYQTMLNGMADPEPLIKSAAALSLARAGFPGAANTLATALSFDNEAQGDWQKTLGLALRLLGKPGHQRVWEMAQSGQTADLDKAVVYFSATSEKAAAHFILQLLDYPHLASESRRVLLRALRPEVDEPFGILIGKRIENLSEVGVEEMALWWEKAEETPWARSTSARDRLLRLLESKSEDERWFALGKFKKQSYAAAAQLLEAKRSTFPLSDPQQRALDEAMVFQKDSQEARQKTK